MTTFQITPKVDETQEFIEIANDFSNPLDIVREAISNAFDAGAKTIEISFNVVKEYGDSNLEITIKDNGSGMDQIGLQSFFDLGNSLSRGNEDKIGEKGHGTKVYFNSSYIEVSTIRDNIKLVAKMVDPIRKLHDRQIPIVDVKQHISEDEPNGTEITIKGYNSNRREKFTHNELKDYILWFTKFSSFEHYFDNCDYQDIVLLLKGLDRKVHEQIKFGHPFPEESKPVQKLFDEHIIACLLYTSRCV